MKLWWWSFAPKADQTCRHLQNTEQRKHVKVAICAQRWSGMQDWRKVNRVQYCLKLINFSTTSYCWYLTRMSTMQLKKVDFSDFELQIWYSCDQLSQYSAIFNLHVLSSSQPALTDNLERFVGVMCHIIAGWDNQPAKPKVNIEVCLDLKDASSICCSSVSKK
jgi:hypothetical protein